VAVRVTERLPDVEVRSAASRLLPEPVEIEAQRNRLSDAIQSMNRL